jgi:hypothetical protein
MAATIGNVRSLRLTDSPTGLLLTPERTSIFQAETDQSPVAATDNGPRAQLFQINDHFVGALVDGVAGAGLATP